MRHYPFIISLDIYGGIFSIINDPSRVCWSRVCDQNKTEHVSLNVLNMITINVDTTLNKDKCQHECKKQ